MPTKISNSYFYIKNNADQFLNHLFVVYVFLLPLTGPKSTVFFFMLALFLIRGNYREYIYQALSNNVILSFFLLFLVVTLWILGSNDLANIPTEIKRMKMLLFPIIFYSFLKPEFVPKAIFAFMLGMFVSELTSYAIFFDIIDPIFYKGYSTVDPSPFMHHSHYGLLLALSSGILFYRLLAYNDSLYLKISTIVFFITITVNIFITGGRMGYLLYGLSIFIVLSMYQVKLYKSILIAGISSILVFLLAYQFSPLFQKRFDNSIHAINKLNTEHPFNSSFGSRLGFIYYAVPVIKDNLIFGVGTGDHLKAVYDEIKKEGKDTFLLKVPHFHDAHLVILVQFGLLGFFIWLNIFYQSIKYEQKNHFMRTILLLAVVLLFFNSFLAAVFKTPILGIFTTLITILTIKVKNNQFEDMYFSKNELIFYLISPPAFYLLKAVS